MTPGPGTRDVAQIANASLDEPVAGETARDSVNRYADRLAGHGVAATAGHLWGRHIAGASEFYISAFATREHV